MWCNVMNSMNNIKSKFIDRLINQFDAFLRITNNVNINIEYINNNQNNQIIDKQLTAKEKSHSAALMRINHVGEVCAQALYKAQKIYAVSPVVKNFMHNSEIEEIQHLNLCYSRINNLGGHTSYLNPVWYIGAFTFGLIAAKFGDKVSLGFVAETERQVEKHLYNHTNMISPKDTVSLQIINSMAKDESKHCKHAIALGAVDLPHVVVKAMNYSAKLMTSIAYYI
jgi:3-demethoxyubiquinol 3-hydroxylase